MYHQKHISCSCSPPNYFVSLPIPHVMHQVLTSQQSQIHPCSNRVSCLSKSQVSNHHEANFFCMPSITSLRTRKLFFFFVLRCRYRPALHSLEVPVAATVDNYRHQHNRSSSSVLKGWMILHSQNNITPASAIIFTNSSVS